MRDDDPRHAGAQPPLPEQQQEPPGKTDAMSPRPDHGEESYRGSGRLDGKAALITGADSGIGRAVAIAYAREGADVAIAYLNEHDDAKETARWVEKAGKRAVLLPGDVADPAHCRSLVERTLKEFGRLDILVNNAGGSRPFDGLGTREQWDEAMALNFHAGRELAHAFVPTMQAQKFGRIINLTGGDEPLALNGGIPPNGATHIWAKSLSRVVGKDGITVNSIPPGRLHSEQIDQRLLPSEEAQRKWVAENCPAGYIGEPEDLAVLVAFISSPRARYITGQVIHVDGGARRFSH
jgi:3-oxoacyl-[acyl-carrier protein] reductase